MNNNRERKRYYDAMDGDNKYAKQKAYYERNKDEINRKKREKYHTPEEKKKHKYRCRKYYHAHWEELNEKHKAYYRQMRDMALKYQRIMGVIQDDTGTKEGIQQTILPPKQTEDKTETKS